MESPSFLRDIFLHKSNRRKILIESMNSYFNLDSSDVNRILVAAENFHFAVTTVDDIMDNETFRNNQPCYYVRHGYDKASIAAFDRFIKFLEITSSLVNITESLLNRLRLMITAQEADTALIARPKDYLPISWYQDVCSCKSSYEILVFLEIFNLYRENALYEKLTILFLHFGRLMQMINDQRDILTDDPLHRFAKSDEIKLTYSLPIAIYLEKIDLSLENKIGKLISQNEFLSIHRQLMSEFIKNETNKLIKSEIDIIYELINQTPGMKNSKVEALYKELINGAFYKLNQNEIFPQ